MRTGTGSTPRSTCAASPPGGAGARCASRSCSSGSAAGGASRPGTVAAPLLVSDLPVFLRWRGELSFGSTELEELVGAADRLIVDSTEWDEPERDLARLPDLFDRVAASDISWRRLDAWRLALARRWPGIASVETVRVAGPRPPAVLLAAWLGARLGRDVELDHEPADEMRAVAVDGETVTGQRSPPRRRATCSRPSWTCSAATPSSRRRYGASRESRPSRLRGRVDRGARRGPQSVPHRPRGRLDAARGLRAPGRDGPRLGVVARLVE